MSLGAAFWHLIPLMKWWQLCVMLLSVDLTGHLQTNNTDCLSLAHEEAYCADILHCDLSPGNIIIGPDGKGLLIDWDLSRTFSDVQPQTPRHATRTVCANAVSCVIIGTNMAFIGYLAVYVWQIDCIE